MSNEFAGATWRKSSRSQNNGACVEVTQVSTTIGVRDSKDPASPILVFGPAGFAAFVKGAAEGRFAN
ncbi:DUF397 domain-containing protein [Micromonospora sp. NPDC050417]|uniref:DUF397 domain-containing protein n=1 Tax=Micromonospora sp. NPDC050417 TaxID=3364280 RepID=UPI0037AF7F9D